MNAINIGFYLTGTNPAAFQYAWIMMRSARRHMPGCVIVQLTDEHTAEAEGINRVLRFATAPLPLLRSAHYASLTGDWVLVDTDVLFQADVAHVFSRSFDIAIADRNWPAQPVSASYSADMPHNAGVVFSRSPAFWWDVNRMCRNYARYQDPWLGDQRAICDLIASHKYSTLILPGNEYNYPPYADDDLAANAQIVHCKGNRKSWMLARA